MSGRTRRVTGVVGLLIVVLGIGSARPVSSHPSDVEARSAPTPVVETWQAIEGLTVEGTTTYRLDEAAGVVHVRSELTLTNTSPPVTTATGTRYYYFDRFVLGAVGPTANVAASRDGTGLSIQVEEPDAYVDLIAVDLSPNLTYGSPQSLVVAYDLPTQPNGSDAVTRVNDAFATWYVSAVGDDGRGEVVIDIPDRFDLEAVTEERGVSEDVDDRTIIRFDDLTLETGFFGVSARDDDALVIRSTTVDDDDYEIQAWPGDEAWADFAVETVEAGIPALGDFVGLDVEGEREITVAESGTPYLYGYGGWYSPSDDRVEIGDQQDLHTMLHELAHLWYHSELFSSRWVTEGLADLAASHTSVDLEGEPLAVEPLDAAASGAQPLGQWDEADPGDVSDDEDAYGYRTSYAVLSAIHDQIGTDALRSIVARADDKLLPLSSDDDVLLRRVDDWRYFYDLLATEPDVDMSTLDPLFDAHVWTDEDRTSVAARRTSMTAYEALADDHGWTPPAAVRKGLADWSFEEATTAIVIAHEAVAEIEEIETTLSNTDAELTWLRESYEQAANIRDLEELIEVLPAHVDAARDLAAVDRRLGDLGPVQRLGLLFRDVGNRQDAAERAFARGDLSGMEDIVAEIDDVIDQSVPSAVALVTVPLFAAFVLVFGVRKLRPRRRPDAFVSASDLPYGMYGQSGQPTDHRPVDAYELEISPQEEFEP